MIEDIERILVVDGDPRSAKVIAEGLAEAAGPAATIERADRLEEALALLAARRFDVAVLDITSPDSGGAGAVERVKEAAPSTTIIALASADAEGMAVSAPGAGAHDYLVRRRCDTVTLARSLRYAVCRKRAEDGLREAGRRMVGILESIAEAFVAADCDWRITYANREAARIAGKRREDLVGRSVWDTWPGAAGGDVERLCRDSMRERRPAQTDYYSPAGDRCFEIRLYPSPDGINIFYRDVTGRKLSEDAVRASEERLRLTAEAAGVGAWQWTVGRETLDWSDTCRALFGLPAGTPVTSGTYDNAIHPEDRGRARKAVEEALAGRADYDIEYRVVWPDGSVHHVLDKGTVIRGGDGQALRMVGAVVDVTRLKRAEEALRALNETLEERVTERTALAEERASELRILALELSQAEQRERRRLAVMLHDNLQQLLAAARMWAGIVRTRAAGDEVREAAGEMDDLLAQAIQASRSLTVDLSPPVLYESGLVAALEWLARWMGEKQSLEVTVESEAGADNVAEAVKVFIFQATKELLFNVVKHATVRSAKVRVSRAGAGFMQVEVSDEGVGFEPRVVRRAADLTAGFGLFSIRERMEILGGRLEVDSAPGAGTRARIVAPVLEQGRGAAAGAAAPRRPRRAARPSRPRRDGDRIRVLLADDHKIMREGLAGLLQKEKDIEIIGEAADGFEAVDLCHRLRPDVVIMDVSMPRLSGLEATRRIAADIPDVRVIGLSLHDVADMAAAMREAGAIAYFAKGGPSESLISAIRSVRPRPPQ